MKRRTVAVCLGVALLLVATIAPALAAQPARESGSQNKIWANGADCVAGGDGTTCDVTSISASRSLATREEIDVCLWQYTYAYSATAGRGPLIGDVGGCSRAPAHALAVTVSRGTLSVGLAETDVALQACNEEGCHVVGTVTASAAATGAATAYASRGPFKSGDCRYQWSVKGYSANPLHGVITIDSVSARIGTGEATTEFYRTVESCG